jgi:hypothetical protein
MSGASSLYETCVELFTHYPLATRVVNYKATIHSMVLLVRDGDQSVYFVLSRDCGEGTPFYSVRPWRTGGELVNIEADGGAVPDWVVSAVTRGVPIPRHGSLFGWRWEDEVTALIAVYAKYGPAFPEPTWALMPRAGIPEVQWPPFTGEHLLGYWFWKHYRAGSVDSLGDLIARTPDAVFWVDTETVLGSDCCVVARDIADHKGHALRRGRYVYYEALLAGKPVPPLDVLLSDPNKTDLAPRFRPYGDPDS